MRKRAGVLFIGISQRLICNESYFEERETLALDWGRFFSDYFESFLPLPLSYEVDFSRYEPYLSGVILSGGNDLNALNPNELSFKRDEYEKQIVRQCFKKNLPLLGICRGAQLIADFFNSSLKSCENHIGEHKITLINGKELVVNSFHNYGVSKLGQDLEPLAFAKDGTVEAFKHKRAKIYALMWHIEREGGLSEESILKQWLRDVKEKK